MAIHFQRSLQEALARIGSEKYKGLEIHPHEIIRMATSEEQSSQIIETYGNAKWSIVDTLNSHYEISKNKFDLYNWLHHNQNDEVAYFLNEAGSNCLNYSQYKAPAKFHLWLGKRGFVIGIEQKGKGFNPLLVEKERKKENEGAAFEFFRNCKAKIFFDNSEDARVVYFEHLF